MRPQPTAYPALRASGRDGCLDSPLRRECPTRLEGLAAIRATPARLTIEDLKMPDLVFQIGVAPRRIDILTSINKKTVGRPQDLADVAWLERPEH
jgi:hypothetical protein